MSGDSIRVLVAEDEEHLGAILEHFLRGRGYIVTMCRDGKTAHETMQRDAFDVALLDIVMPEMDGLDVLRAASSLRSPPEIIIITGNGTIDTAITAIKLGAYDYISKPYRMAEIDVMVRRAWEKRELMKGNAALRKQLALHRRDLASLGALDAVVSEGAATNDALVLVGETGSGKSALARAIHERSPKPSDACVEIGETELAGAPLSDHVGIAERGTLIVDIDGMREETLEEIVAIDAHKSGRGPSPRIIACTTSEESGSAFAKRCGAHVIPVPPLRSRKAEIGALANAIVSTMDGAPGLTDAAIETLRAYSWPGNVRELALVLERAALLAGGTEAIDVTHLSIGGGATGRASTDAAALSDLEKRHIEAMLVRHGWHQGRAASALGISTKTLYRKMREFGFTRPRRRKLARARDES